MRSKHIVLLALAGLFFALSSAALLNFLMIEDIISPSELPYLHREQLVSKWLVCASLVVLVVVVTWRVRAHVRRRSNPGGFPIVAKSSGGHERNIQNYRRRSTGTRGG